MRALLVILYTSLVCIYTGDVIYQYICVHVFYTLYSFRWVRTFVFFYMLALYVYMQATLFTNIYVYIFFILCIVVGEYVPLRCVYIFVFVHCPRWLNVSTLVYTNARRLNCSPVLGVECCVYTYFESIYTIISPLYLVRMYTAPVLVLICIYIPSPLSVWGYTRTLDA